LRATRSFEGAKKFNQDLGWCLDDDVRHEGAFRGTPCKSTSCGVHYSAALSCDGVMSNSGIRDAVAAWLKIENRCRTQERIGVDATGREVRASYACRGVCRESCEGC